MMRASRFRWFLLIPADVSGGFVRAVVLRFVHSFVNSGLDVISYASRNCLVSIIYLENIPKTLSKVKRGIIEFICSGDVLTRTGLNGGRGCSEVKIKSVIMRRLLAMTKQNNQ